jgi:hypothetical protein
MSQGTNLDLLLSTDYLSLEDEKILEAKTEKEKVSTSEGASLAIEQEMLLPSILKSFGQENLEPDYNYRIDDETFDNLTKDLGKEYWEEFSMASSKTNAYQIRERLLRSQEADQKLSALGVKGTALRFGAAMLDPLALAADAVTFGIARPFIYANKISRTSKYIRSGLVGAGQAGLITAPVIAADPTIDIEDVGYAMLMGGAITSGLTRFMAPKHPDLRKFDAKSQELGKAMEKNTLVNDGHTITPKGETYFPPERPVTKSTYTDEVDELLPPETSIKPTNKNIYSEAEQEIVDSIKNNKVEDVVANFFDRLDKTPNVAFAKFRGDKSSVLRRSASPFTRSWSEKMAEEAVGNTDSSRSIITSDLIKHNYATTTETLFYKSYAPAFQKFMKEVKNRRFGNDYNINDRMEFSTLVSRAVRGEIIDVPGVEEGVLATRKVLKKILDDLKKDGVQGAKEVLDNPNYFPRRWSINKMQEMQTKVPYNKLINFLKNSLVRGSKNLSDEYGLRIAKQIYKVVNTNKFGDGFSIDRLLATTDADELRTLIRDYADLNPDELEDLVGALLKPGRDKPTAVPRLRRRASFDENYEETIDSFKVKFTDLLDNNTEGLMGSYIQQMSGQIALARNGIKSVQDYSKIIKQVKDSYDNPEIAKSYTGFLGNARKELELNTIDTIYKNIVGIPTEKNITGAVSTALRNLRKYNYVNVFNQVGFAQIPEMGNIVATAGVRGMIKYIPEFKNIITRAKSGKLSNELLDEIETVVSGTGSNRLIDSTINRTDDFAGATTRVGKVEKTLDIASRITADFSGFHAVDTLSRRLAAITAFDKLAMHATGKYKVTESVLNRYRNIGFSDDELQAVFKNIRENSTFIEGGLTGRKIRRLNIDKWDDQDLVNKMSLYMSRHLRRVIQENNYGEMLAIGTDSGLGKTMLQFRNFVITAYSKQLLHGLHMRDFTALAGAMSSAFIASLVYIAQTNVQALGKSESEKEEFLEKRLSIGSIGKAAFQRSTYASLLPIFYDTLASPFGGEPMFNYRTSGLEINLITGNPTYNLIDKGFGAIKSIGTALADDEYDFSKQSAYKIKAILPYQNMLGITNILQYMIDESDLPSTSK